MHRAMQASGMMVTASAPSSGPCALAAFVDAEFEGEVSGGRHRHRHLRVEANNSRVTDRYQQLHAQLADEGYAATKVGMRS